MAITLIIIKVICIYLLADFATGIFHFYADNYGEMDGKFLTNSVNLLLIHHIEPEKITTQNYWELTGGVYKFSFIFFPISIMLLGFHWEILLFLIIGAHANIIHKWSHSSDDETPFLAKILQKIKLIQNKSHHQNHHMANFHKNYCVMTPYVNPFLETFFFWQGIIKFFNFFGVKPTQQ